MKSKTLFAGIDWASKTHLVCVVDETGGIRARFEIANTGKTFAGLVNRLTRLDVHGVAIERCDGPLVEALVDAVLRVVVITPRQVKGLHSRYRRLRGQVRRRRRLPARRRAAHRRAPAARPDPGQRRHRGAAVPDPNPQTAGRARVGLVNQLQAELERVFPGAIGLFARLDSDVAIAFLRRYPITVAASRLTKVRLAAFLRRISYSGRKPVEELFARVHDAPPAGISPEQAEGRAVAVLALLRAIDGVHREERELQAEIIERLEAHADAHIFTSLPKAGHGVRAATLLAEIGDDRAATPTKNP
jgi:hypothetical protein